MENREEIKRFLELIANSVGETITEYHWREACGLIAGIDPYKEDAPTNMFLLDEAGVWQSLPDRMKDTQEEYNKLLNKLNSFAEYKQKFVWLKETDGKEGMDFKYIDRFKIPFDFDSLWEGDRIKNESEEELIYREEERFYNFINNDVDKFLSDSMIYQEWKRI